MTSKSGCSREKISKTINFCVASAQEFGYLIQALFLYAIIAPYDRIYTQFPPYPLPGSTGSKRETKAGARGGEKAERHYLSTVSGEGTNPGEDTP